MISGYQDGGALAYAAAENLKRAKQEAVWLETELTEAKNNIIKKEINKIKGRSPDLSSKPTERETKPQKRLEIDSPAFDRLMQAIEAFPVEHSDYKTKPPKRERIQEWVRSRFVSNDKTREPSFIAKVIIEHFDIPDKTGRRSKT